MKIPDTNFPRLVAIACSMCLVLAAAACTEEDPDNSNILDPTGDAGNNNGNNIEDDVTDDTDTDTDSDLCADVTCGDEELCYEGECEPAADDGYGCNVPHEIGELSDGDSVSVTADATGQPNLTNTWCSNDDESPQAVFSFSVDEPMEIDVSIADHTDPVLINIREDDCRDESEETHCSNSFEQTVYAEPGVTYFVIVEAVQGWNLGEFTLEFETSGLFCAPPGAWHCEDDVRVECFAGTREERGECAADCVDDECMGEGCHNPIVVDGSITVEGNTYGYDNEGRFDFSDSPLCSTDGVSGPSSDGQDQVYLLPDLHPGQVVVVDVTNSPTTHLFGILENCDETNVQCIAGNDTDVVWEWEVPEGVDGDRYLVINRFSSSRTDFQYTIEILN